MTSWPTRKLGEKLFSEDVVAYSLYKHYISENSKVFFKLAHNISIKDEREWSYWCAPEIDVIEVLENDTVIGYELKGVRKYKKTEENWPAFYDGIGQAIAYLDLPWVYDNKIKQRRFSGGAFDFVYLVYPRKQKEFPEYENRIFDLLPIGVLIALPSGEFFKAKEAPKNLLFDEQAKKHFLENLHTIEKHSTNSRIFRKIKGDGEEFFQK